MLIARVNAHHSLVIVFFLETIVTLVVSHSGTEVLEQVFFIGKLMLKAVITSH